MKPSKFYQLYRDDKFLDLFRQIMTLIVADRIRYYSERNELNEFIRPSSSLDRFERRVRDFCYQKAAEGDGAMDAHLITVRALFDLSDEDDLVYTETGELDMDASFLILYQKIAESNLLNIIAGAKPEELGIVS